MKIGMATFRPSPISNQFILSRKRELPYSTLSEFWTTPALGSRSITSGERGRDATSVSFNERQNGSDFKNGILSCLRRQESTKKLTRKRVRGTRGPKPRAWK